jgi:hypothetical protein
MSDLQKLVEDHGYDDAMAFLETECSDCVVPAICTTCKVTCDGEPDLDKGWCEGCRHATVKSALVLAGVI